MSASDRPLGGGADDDAAGEAVLLAELLDDAAQARPLFARLDLAGHADVIDRRHEHQEAPRHRDVRRQPRALGAERLLDDLDQDLLALLQQVFDLRLRLIPIAVAVAPADRRVGRRRRPAARPSPAPARHRRLGGRLTPSARHRPPDGGSGLLVLVVVIVTGEAARTPRRC